MTLFQREYNLAIGTGSEAIEITQLQVIFEVTKSLESNGNTCKLSIYNLSDTSRIRLETVDQVVVLKAGYKDNLKTIFIGTTVRTSHLREGHDLITQVICKDGNISLREAKTNRIFPPGIRLESILRTLVKDDLKLSVGEVVGDNLSKTYQTGITITGHTKKAMDNLTSSAQLQWSVQDNVVDIIGKNTSSRESIPLISPSTGLIGAPQRTDGFQEQLKGADVPSTGVTFSSLLNGSIRPGRPIKLESEFVNGIYKVVKLTHSGDFRGSSWFTKIEGDQLSA